MKKVILSLIVGVCVCQAHAQNWLQKKLGATTKEEREEYKEAKKEDKEAVKALMEAQKDRAKACCQQTPLSQTVDKLRTGIGLPTQCEAAKGRENLEGNNFRDKREALGKKEKEYKEAKKREGAWR